MASAGFFGSADDKGYNFASFTRWPLAYIPETKEYMCTCCGQVLVANHTPEDLETHFKSCEIFEENGFAMVFNAIGNQKADVDTKINQLKVDVDTKLNDDVAAKIEDLIDDMNTKEDNLVESVQEVLKDIKSDFLKEFDTKTQETISLKLQALEEKIGKALEKKIGVAQKKFKTQMEKLIANFKIEIEKKLEKTGQKLGLKRQLEEEVAKQLEEEAAKQLTKKKKAIHVQEPSPWDQWTIPMNDFNLVFQNYNFQPSFRWTINGIEAILEEKTFEMTSEMFQWNGYPVQAQAKLLLTEDCRFHVSMCFKIIANEPNFLIPRVFYLLKDKMGHANHNCASINYMFRTPFQNSLNFETSLGSKVWYALPSYKVNNSIEIDIYIEPSRMVQLAHSFNGTLEWTIENYKKNFELEKNGLVDCHRSPYFYTGPQGYRVQVDMVLNGGQGRELTARIMFLTGNFDADLPVSFPHSTTLTFINRKNPEKNFSKTRLVDKDNIINSRFYNLESVKYEEAADLIENDALFCKVEIKAL